MRGIQELRQARLSNISCVSSSVLRAFHSQLPFNLCRLRLAPRHPSAEIKQSRCCRTVRGWNNRSEVAAYSLLLIAIISDTSLRPDTPSTPLFVCDRCHVGNPLPLPFCPACGYDPSVVAVTDPLSAPASIVVQSQPAISELQVSHKTVTIYYDQTAAEKLKTAHTVTEGKDSSSAGEWRPLPSNDKDKKDWLPLPPVPSSSKDSYDDYPRKQ